MSVHPVTCEGPHTDGGPVLALADSPGARGLICADCGDAYRQAVGHGRWPAGATPDADVIAAELPGLRPAGWQPRHPFHPPSWAPAPAHGGPPAPSWPPPPRPAPPAPAPAPSGP